MNKQCMGIRVSFNIAYSPFVRYPVETPRIMDLRCFEEEEESIDSTEGALPIMIEDTHLPPVVVVVFEPWMSRLDTVVPLPPPMPMPVFLN